MTILDLLNDYSKGITYKKVKLVETDDICIYRDNDYHVEGFNGLFLNYINRICNLLDEIEIIEEEKEIEKIDFRTLKTQKEKNRVMKDTINQLIDEISKLKKGNDDLSIK